MLPTQITEKIWAIENVLSPVRCDELIKHSEGIGYQEATVSLPQGATMIKGLRDNYRVTFQNSGLAKSLFKKLQAGLPIIDGGSSPTQDRHGSLICARAEA